MDPLSISAGVVGLAGFTVHSLRKTKEFIDSIQGAPRAVNALSSDIDALHQIVEKLTTNVDEAESDETRYRTLVPLEKPLQNLTDVIESLTTLIRPYTKPTSHAGRFKWRRISWSFKEKEIAGLQIRLISCKATLELALSFIHL